MRTSWLKIFLIISLFIAQLAIAIHFDCAEDVVARQECIYCDVATEFSGADVPCCLRVAYPENCSERLKFYFDDNVKVRKVCYLFSTRAPPFA